MKTYTISAESAATLTRDANAPILPTEVEFSKNRVTATYWDGQKAVYLGFDEFLAAHELDRSEFRSVAKAVILARKGQLIELCRSNSVGSVFVAPSVIEYRQAEDDEVLPETVEPFFYRVSDVNEA